MSEGLPDRIDIARLAARGASIISVTPVAAMQRLVELLAEDSGEVHSKVLIGLDRQSRRVVSGNAQAQLKVTCQRCLKQMDVNVETEFDLIVVGDESEAGPDELDLIISDDRQVSLLAVVEDELILALPVAAMHEDRSGCGS